MMVMMVMRLTKEDQTRSATGRASDFDLTALKICHVGLEFRPLGLYRLSSGPANKGRSVTDTI